MLTEPSSTFTRRRSPVSTDRARVAALRAWGAALVGVFVLLAVLTAVKAFKGPDQSVDDTLNRFALSHAGVTDLLKAVTQAGEPTIALGLGLLAAVAFYAARMRSSATFAAAAVIGAYAIAYIAKKAVNRHRPRWDAAHTVVTDHGASFPSGHATGSSALATVLIVAAVPLLASVAARRVAVIVLVLYVLTMVVSRPILGVHFPTDVLAGAVLGSGWALVCASVVRPWLDRPSAG
ncbi:phosphatase PAP2 family protein [Catenulispora subtropica]|uniref:Phosphatidic acid phosphatase type 2/haloperoxidase domain-containing protein n=1 Tax=Catenulispora subtropica TaxID=450798 RepID=A0ABP5DCV7_9ACTN